MNLTNCIPTAYAEIHGTASFPKLHGMAYFYDVTNGTVVVAEVEGLPDEDAQGAGSFFGFHIHEGSRCSGTPQDLLSATGGHYNPTHRPHPYHAGDLPPLLSMAGSAWCAVYTGRFRPDQVIKGWTEALKMMPEGSTWELFIPYDLAYGENGTQNIPPYSTLIFKVEVIKVGKK